MKRPNKRTLIVGGVVLALIAGMGGFWVFTGSAPGKLSEAPGFVLPGQSATFHRSASVADTFKKLFSDLPDGWEEIYNSRAVSQKATLSKKPWTIKVTGERAHPNECQVVIERAWWPWTS